MDIHQLLADEINNDPLTRGYAGMTDQQVADDINTSYRTRPVDRVATDDIFEAVVPSEYAPRKPNEKTILDTLFAAHPFVGVPLGGSAQTVILNIFGPGTATRANLIVLATESITRGVELGIGTPHAGDVGFARSLP